ncbi:MAG: hypothetical protein ACYCQJ_02565 [Nitrososphaerales archaeon]
MKEDEILQLLLMSLLADFTRIEKHLVLYEDDSDKLSVFTSAKQRTAKSILDCLSMIRDPRFQSLNEDQKRDFARMISSLKNLQRNEDSQKKESDEKLDSGSTVNA